MNKPTPGPWKVFQHNGKVGFHTVNVNARTRICSMHDGSLADARLIAAAPDLLSACLTLLAAWDAGEETQNVAWEDLTVAVDQAREAAAKTEDR